MVGKDVKGEARKKLALNMHQAIIVYTIELTIFITLIALVVMSCVVVGSAINNIAAIVMICYGSILFVIAFVGAGMVNFAMTDFYLVSYKCQPYNIRRLGETIARSNITKVFLMSLKRTFISFLLLLCLIVPGVIYMIRTSMASFLLIANPKMKPSAALTASNKVMSGKTGMYFSLIVSLIGWYILGLLTLGLGFIFITPYINLVKTVFYKRNLQGDRGTYTVSPQTLASTAQSMSQPARPQPIAGQTDQPIINTPEQNSAPGPAPIDALADEDVMDMNAAMQDFGGTGVDNTSARSSIDNIPEVPLGVPNKKPEKQGKTKLTREEKRLTKEAARQEKQSRKIDGTGLVETERTLTTQELSDSDAMQRLELEHMYSNAERQRPTVNYFDINGPTDNNNDDFNDDFGVTPITDDQPIEADQPVQVEADTFGDVFAQPTEQPEQDPFADSFDAEPVQPEVDSFDAFAQPVADEVVQADEPIISDSEFDEFLRNFDIDDNNDVALEMDDMSQDPLKDEQNADTDIGDSMQTQSDSPAHERPSTSERVIRPTSPPRGDVADRAERLRREREERLKNLNQKK